MLDPIEHIIAYPDLSDDEKAELRRAISADPTLAALVLCRDEIAASIREEWSGPTTDPRLFTLLSLYRSGRAGDLAADESELVAINAGRFEHALRQHPGLAIASDDVAGAAAEFSDIWDAHFDTGAAADRDAADGAANERRLSRGRQPAATRLSAAPRRRRRAYRWAVRSAIAVAVAAFAIIVTLVADRDSGMLTVQTGEGEMRLVELGEGSRIRLLESSTLSYGDPQSSINRRAELIGRAYFEISPAGRGFLVETPTARATVLGTTFGVDAQERLTEVVLTEGRLTLARSEVLKDFVLLEPGQMSRVTAGGSPSPPVPVDVSRRLTWTGLFIFQSTPLGDIATLLSEHFGVVVTVAEELSEERVTGTFEQNQPLGEILDVIASAVGASVQANGTGGYALTHL